MFNTRIGRILTGTAIAASAFAMMAAPTAANAASAAKAPGIACKSMTGTITGTVTLKKCTGNTGKASKALPASALASGGTITWKNGKSTTVTLAVKQGSGAKCKIGSTEYDATGKTTADTTGSAKVKGKVKASVCVSATGAVTLVPGSQATFA